MARPSGYSNSGQILMLDMGEPVKIVDLARQLIKITGREEGKIPIQFIGLKQGEKLFEKLSCDSECCTATEHPKIMLYTSEFDQDPEKLTSEINSWVDQLQLNGADLNVRSVIKSLVTEYEPSGLSLYVKRGKMTQGPRLTAVRSTKFHN